MHIFNYFYFNDQIFISKQIGKKNFKGKIANTYTVNCMVMHLMPPTNKSMNYNNSLSYYFSTALLPTGRSRGRTVPLAQKKQIAGHLSKMHKTTRFYLFHYK